MKFEPTVVEFVIYTYRAYVVLVLAIFFPHLVQTHAKVTKTKKKKNQTSQRSLKQTDKCERSEQSAVAAVRLLWH